MKNNSETLAKLARPRNQNIYQRAGLFKKLDQARRAPAVWISAPPGSGKTTLVSSYLQKNTCASIWYHIDENDLDVATLFWYMRLAARDYSHQGYAQLPAYTSAYKGGLGAFAARYFEKLYTCLGQEFVIVIDDIHLAESNKSLLTVLSKAIAALPANGNIVITSRDPVPAEFCSMLANETLSVLDWEDLRLSADELRGIATMRKPELSKESIEQLTAVVDGWVAGFIFCLHHSELVPLTSDCGLHHEALFGYFANEVFERQGKRKQQQLMKMALFPRMTQAMACQLTENDSASTLLNYLHRQNYFVNLESLDVPTYKFHPLFRHFLLHRLKESYSKDELIHLYHQAAKILEANGYQGAACDLYKHMEIWSGVVRVIMAGAADKYRQGRMENLALQIQSLPAEVLADYPWLQYWLAMCMMFLQPKAAYNLFGSAFERFETERNMVGSLAAWAGGVNALLTEWEDITRLEQWLIVGENLKGIDGDLKDLKIGVHATTAMCFAMFLCRPHSPALTSLIERVHARLISGEDMTFSLMAANLLIIFYGWLGELTKAKLLLDAIASKMQQQEVSVAHQVMWAAASGWFELLSGQPQKCLDQSTRAFKFAHASGVHLFDQRFLGMQAQACLVLGRCDEAHEHIRRYANVVPAQANLIHFHANYLSAWGKWLSGDANGAREYLNLAAQFLGNAGSPPLIDAKLNIADAILKYESGDQVGARASLKVAKLIAEQTSSAWLRFHCELIEANDDANKGNIRECVKQLRSALHIGHLHNLVTTDWWAPKMMSHLCEVALTHQVEVDYVRDLIDKTNLNPGSVIAASNGWPWPVSARLMGEFELTILGKSASKNVLKQKKVLALLKLLLVNDMPAVSLVRVADLLWPEAEGDDARNTLKTTIHRLRKALGSSESVVIDSGSLSLNPDYIWSDVGVIYALAGASLSDNSGVLRMKQLLKLFGGALLPDDDSPWVITARNKLLRIEHEVVMKLGTRYENRHRWRKAIRVYRQGFEVDALDEQVCRHLMQCYKHSGRDAEALAAYEQCRAQLQQQVARQPSAKTQALVKSMLQH